MSVFTFIDPFVTSLAVPALAGLLISLLFELLFLVPRRCICLNRGSTAYGVHAASWLSFFLVCLLLFQRPWFAVLLTTSLQLLILAVNFAKYHSLREPFILQDFEYFADLIRHPRLYLPFFGIWNAILGSVLFITLVTTALMLEASLLVTVDAVLFFSVVTALFIAMSFAARRFAARLPVPQLKPADDIRAVGLYASFWGYYLAFGKMPELQPRPAFCDDGAPADVNRLPDLLVVQSESFFDPRLSYRSVRKDVLSHYDRIVGQSLCHGSLRVPAWGANTVRTESAFLTGLNPAQMGIHQFNPYWYLSRKRLPNLVSRLKSQGYRTICVHPYPVGFYMRDKVFPKLGFDQFIDISEFNPEQKDGQYISDAAVARKLTDVLEQQVHPCFIFTITMENHGPLHLESEQGVNIDALYSDPPPADARDLTVYLRHLKNADRMLDRLTGFLRDRQRKSYLCWYGDHVPVMTGVYKSMGEPLAETPYLIWCSDPQAAVSDELPLAVDQLAIELLERAVNSDCGIIDSSELIGREAGADKKVCPDV